MSHGDDGKAVQELRCCKPHFAPRFVDSVADAVQFCGLWRGRKPRSSSEGPLLTWQQPNGPAWRDVAQWCVALGGSTGALRGVTARLCLLGLTLAAAVAVASEPPYALLGRAAPDFALHAAAGDTVRLSEHRGEVVVVSFWSSRCTSCRTQLTALNRSFATYRSAGLAIYGVGVDDDPVQSQDFARSAAVDFALLLDPAKMVSRSYEVDNLPMTVLIDRGGTVRYVLREYSAAISALYLQELRALLND